MQATAGRISVLVAILAGASCSNDAPNDPLVALYCDDGYVMLADGSGCVPAPDLVVQGIVTDATTGAPVPGVVVTVFPSGTGDDVLTTDQNGYFSRTSVATSADLLVSYIHPDYAFFSQNITKTMTGLGLLVVDASAVLSHNVQHLRVAGMVYAGDAPAPGAHVYLSVAATGPFAYTAVADENGHFAFEDVAEAAYFLRVPPFDVDGDQVNDFAGASLNLGNLGTTVLNVSNLVVALPRMTKQLLYTTLTGVTLPTSFPVPTASCPAGAAPLCDGLWFVSPADDLVFHFGAEVEVTAVDVVLRPYEPAGGYGAPLGFVATWSIGDTVLTLNPDADLLSDADTHTQYEVTFNALVWKDGQVAISQSSASSVQRFRFDIDGGPTLLSSPTPQLYTDNIVATSGQVVDHVTCDADLCCLLDDVGFYVGGYGATTAAMTGATGFQLTWPAVPGAHSYNVYARQRNDNDSSDNFRNWYLVSNTIASGPVDPALGPTVYATGVMIDNLAAAPREWDDFDLTGAGALAFGNEIDVAVTAANVDGFESPLDPARVITFTDGMPAALAAVTADVSAGTDIGTSLITKVWRLDFAEAMDTAVAPTTAMKSGNIVQYSDGGLVGWDPLDPYTPQNVSASALVLAQLRIRGACTPVTCSATFNAVQPALSDDRICVADPSLFTATDPIFVMNVATATRTHVVRNVTAVDAATGIVKLDAAVANTITAGSTVACLARALAGHVTTLVNVPGGAIVDVADASLFYAGEPVLLFDTAGDDLLATSVTAIDTVLNKVTLAGNPGATFAAGSTTLQRRPLTTEYAYRAATTVAFRTDATLGAYPTNLPLATSLAATTVMVGDLVMVDQDGDLRTIADRYYGTVSAVVMTPDDGATPAIDETDYHLTLVAPPAGKPTIPNGLFLLHGTSTATVLGDSLGIVNADPAGTAPVRDTSQNRGMTRTRDEWSAGPLFY